MYIYRYTYREMCVYMYIEICVHMYIYICIHIYIYIERVSDIHTHMQCSKNTFKKYALKVIPSCVVRMYIRERQ